MLILILSPALAFVSDFIRQKLFISKKWIFLLICVSTIPSLIIWLAGYDYSEIKLLGYAIMFIIASGFLAFYSLIDNRFGLKIAISILASLFILAITFLGAMGTSFGGGKREVISQSKYKNYIVLHLEPQLYEDEKTLRIKKTRLLGFIEKTIFETSYIDTLVTQKCQYYFEDNKVHLVYDLCKQELTSH